MRPAWFEPNPWMKRDRPMDEIERRDSRPPSTETIEWHLTFAAEAYLPSHSAYLSSRLRELGWSQRRWSPASSEDLVLRMRQGTLGGSWATLKTLLPVVPTFDVFQDRQADTLPDGASAVQLWLWSATPSLTLLVAGVEWDETRGEALDRIAKSDYPSIAVPSGNGYSMYTPVYHKKLEAENCRRRTHREVASWLRERVPGAFADLNAPVPILDVITAALSRPYTEDASGISDYRKVLGIEQPFEVGTSPSFPAWTLALADRDSPGVLSLGARTIDAVESVERINGRVEETRWQLMQHFGSELLGLLSGWTTLSLLDAFQAYFSTTRDRARGGNESLRAFAGRLSTDEMAVLRRGSDVSALCVDVETWPPDYGPAVLFRNLDFTINDRFDRTYDLRESWQARLKENAENVARSERDERQRLSTSAEVLGLAQNVRVQWQIRALTLALLIAAVLTIALTVLSLRHGGDSTPSPAPVPTTTPQ